MHGIRIGPLLRLIAVGGIGAVVVAACGPDVDRATWGDEAIAYYEEWSQALTDDDVYGVLDFYAPEATVRGRKGGIEGFVRPAADWVAGHRADLGQDLAAVHLGDGEAVVTIAWPDQGDHGAYVITMDGGAISEQVVLVDLASLERSLLASPDVAASYRTLYEDVAAARSSGDTNGVYAAGVATGVGAWSTVADQPIYLEAGRYGHDPEHAVARYEAGTGAGCTYHIAVQWSLADGLIVEERIYPEVESWRVWISRPVRWLVDRPRAAPAP